MNAGASPDHTLRARFERHLLHSRLLDNHNRILVALSGGLDSIVLLDLLRHRPATVIAAHFDHGMRLDSAADAAWVRALCLRLGVVLFDARSASPAHNEAGARNQRYTFLRQAASRARASVIVTAHHADDQAETVLFRLIRGTGLPGLAGIPARRGMLVRPLLPFTRADLAEHARAQTLEWRDDPSNAEVRFARNRIRHEVMPALERMAPGAAQRMARLAQRVSEAESAWGDVVAAGVRDVVTAQESWGYALARERILAYHPHVRARVIRHVLGGMGSHPDRAATRYVMTFLETGVSGGRIELAGGAVIEREFDRLLIRRPAAAFRVDVPDVTVQIVAPGTGSARLVAGGQTFEARWSVGPSGPGPGERASFDLSSLRFPLALRGWQAGDRIRLGGGTRKLKKLFQEERVGRSRRGSVPVLADADGEVIWVAGVARSARHSPPGNSVFEITVVDVTAS